MKLRLTYLMILIIIGISIFVWASENTDETVEDFGFSGENLAGGEVWTLITSIFLHGNPAHLVLNSIALFFFGRALEEELSWETFLIIFFIGGIVGNLFVLFTYPMEQVVIGASGAVFAIMGTAIILTPFDFIPYPVPLPLPLALVGIFIAVSEIVSFMTGGHGNIAHIAHIGGMATGIAFGFREGGSKQGLAIVAMLMIFLLLMPHLGPLIEEISYLPLIKDFLG
ncbi:MAG: rhomboid family intramembrane serine protease [Candidatus Aenigmatarchaeota archaeon]